MLTDYLLVLQAGNEAVLRARFQDAQFFFQEDLKRPLADFRQLLAGTVFQKDLGTLLDKSVSTLLCTTLHCVFSPQWPVFQKEYWYHDR